MYQDVDQMYFQLVPVVHLYPFLSAKIKLLCICTVPPISFSAGIHGC